MFHSCHVTLILIEVRFVAVLRQFWEWCILFWKMFFVCACSDAAKFCVNHLQLPRLPLWFLVFECAYLQITEVYSRLWIFTVVLWCSCQKQKNSVDVYDISKFTSFTIRAVKMNYADRNANQNSVLLFCFVPSWM